MQSGVVSVVFRYREIIRSGNLTLTVDVLVLRATYAVADIVSEACWLRASLPVNRIFLPVPIYFFFKSTLYRSTASANVLKSDCWSGWSFILSNISFCLPFSFSFSSLNFLFLVAFFPSPNSPSWSPSFASSLSTALLGISIPGFSDFPLACKRSTSFLP